MLTYIVRRFFQGLCFLVLSSLVLYTLVVYMPGGIVSSKATGNERDANYWFALKHYDQLENQFRIDRPWPMNYLSWLFDPGRAGPGVDLQLGNVHIHGSGVLTGNLGRSMGLIGRPAISDLISSRINNTLILVLTALFLSILIAFPLGMLSAIKQPSRGGTAISTFSVIAPAMPAFWLGLVFMILLSALPRELHRATGWGWIPYLPSGEVSPLGEETDLPNRVYHLVLPITVLVFGSVAWLSEFVRATMLDVMSEDYLFAARARGVSGRAMVLKHALPNAMIPVFTAMAVGLPGLLSAVIVVETVFNYRGLGQLYYSAVSTMDLPLVMGLLLLATIGTVFSNTVADVLMYADRILHRRYVPHMPQYQQADAFVYVRTIV